MSAVAALLGTTLAIASPAQAQTASGATAAAAPVNRMVVFGDSLADGGYYLTLDPRLPRDAGSFTTNPDPVAPEVVAARLGLPLTPVYGQGGTNYAVGGARVTAANALSIPITTQITNFLGAGGTFGPRDLVYVQGGGNDYFAFQAGGGANPEILTTAATQLATQVSRLQGAGAQRIVTLAVQTGGAAGLALFNRTYAAALAAANVNALYFDTDRLFNELVTSPATYGYTNITGVACTVPSSLACTRATLVTPNANETYILADSVHPAGITQRIQGQAIASLVQAPDQIAGLGYAAQAMFRAQRDLLEGPERGGSQRDGRALSVFGGAAYHYYASGNSAQRVGINERGFSGTLGADLAIGEARASGSQAPIRTGRAISRTGRDATSRAPGPRAAMRAASWGRSGCWRTGPMARSTIARSGAACSSGRRSARMTARPTAITSRAGSRARSTWSAPAVSPSDPIWRCNMTASGWRAMPRRADCRPRRRSVASRSRA
ncbi:hypothetical protein NI18_12970 [Sphingomonas sp. Ant20]|nr:hypothetical protein NI18_12970 [Sphingomonas sp. Ant20]